MTPDILEHTGKMDINKPEILFASLQILLDTYPDMIFVKDKNLTYVAGTQSFAKMLGKATMDEVLGRTDAEVLEDNELAKLYTDDDKKVFESKQNIINFIEPLTDEDGKPRYSLTSKYILTDKTGETIGLLGISKDITKEIKTKQQNLQEIKYLLTLTENTHSTVLIDITDWKIIEQRLSPTKK